MNKTRVIILGAGYRGRAFAEYAKAFPDKIEIVAVADKINSETIPASLYFDEWRDAIIAKVPADLVIVALPDSYHYEATIASLKAGYHVLCEKPLGRSRLECDDIKAEAARTGKLVMVGYELRFSRYFAQIKTIIESGAIGEVVTIAHQESVGYKKAAHSFVRGALSRAKDSTPLLLSKCSHDLDLFLWWMGGKKVVGGYSFGSLQFFKRENAPETSAEMCCECPLEGECVWSSKNIYLGSDELDYLFSDPSESAKRSIATSEPYGRCVFKCGNDVADRQTVIYEFEGGALATLVISAFTNENRRRTIITGTEGEIFADGQEVKVNRFDGKSVMIDSAVDTNESRHDGGDFNLISETLRLISEGSAEEYASILTESLRSHYLAFETEKRRN